MVSKEKILKFSLLALIAATVIFIFVQSALPPEKSSAESEAVGGVIEEIIPSDTKPGAFIQLNLRKIAHFVEFAALGLEIALFVSFFMRRRIFVFLSYPAALITAFFDESVQMFSGRGPAILDVWIDFFGFFFLATLSYVIFFTVKYFLKRGTPKNNGKNN